MYLLVEKETNIVVALFEKSEAHEQGKVYTDKNGLEIIYPDDVLIKFNENNVEESVIPGDFNTGYYCYDSLKGFYENKNVFDYLNDAEKIILLKSALSAQQEITDTVILDNLNMQAQIDSLIMSSLG